ncbi:PEP-CTERM sorting domain-containing protein [Pontiellaceae bacterium B12219]|nr:PEP-CTERM sorting domain-containing protein [Pontiellaceae bacterium B12219]
MKKSTSIGAALLLAAGVAQAATISWGSATTVTDETDVSTLGTLEYAESWGAAVSDVNGVDFVLASNGNVTRSDGATDRTHNRTDNVPSQVAQSGAYYDLLRSGWYSADAGKSITLNNLTEDQEYLVQIWSSDDRYGINQEQVVDGVTLETSLGQYVIGTFTADATTQDLAFSGTDSGIMTAVQVRAIPEPATIGLIGAFGGGLLFVRRRFMV